MPKRAEAYYFKGTTRLAYNTLLSVGRKEYVDITQKLSRTKATNNSNCLWQASSRIVSGFLDQGSKLGVIHNGSLYR